MLRRLGRNSGMVWIHDGSPPEFIGNGPYGWLWVMTMDEEYEGERSLTKFAIVLIGISVYT